MFPISLYSTSRWQDVKPASQVSPQQQVAHFDALPIVDTAQEVKICNENCEFPHSSIIESMLLTASKETKKKKKKKTTRQQYDNTR